MKAMSDLLDKLKNSLAEANNDVVNVSIELFKETISDIERCRKEIRECALSLISCDGQRFENYERYFEAEKNLSQLGFEITGAATNPTSSSDIDAVLSEIKLMKSKLALLQKLINVSNKVLSKLDSPTASVTQWDADELREALEELK